MNYKKGIAPMNDYRITLTKRAKDDIIDIGDYISHTLLQPYISKNFIKGLRHSISQLRTFPQKFPLIQDSTLATHSIRCMPYKNYYIFYTILENNQTVIILRIGYNRRNWNEIL